MHDRAARAIEQPVPSRRSATVHPGAGAIRAAAGLLGCVGLLVCGRPTHLHAQRVQLRPQAGLYLPTKLSVRDGVLHVRQKLGLTAGVALTVTFDERFDIFAALTYIPGYAVLHGAGKRIDLGASSHQLSLTIRPRYWLISPARSLSWDVHSGLGLQFGGRPAYADFFQSTLSGIVGTTVTYRIGQIVSLQMQVQERLIRVRFGGQDARRPQPPLRVSFGFTLPFLELAH